VFQNIVCTYDISVLRHVINPQSETLRSSVFGYPGLSENIQPIMDLAVVVIFSNDLHAPLHSTKYAQATNDSHLNLDLIGCTRCSSKRSKSKRLPRINMVMYHPEVLQQSYIFTNMFFLPP